MANFTLELRHVVDYFDELGVGIGLDDYPIFQEAYRPTLNKNILDKFKFREIGFETAEMFRHHLNARMRLIMPYYNNMYESTFTGLEAKQNYNLTTVGTSNINAENVGSTTQTSDAKSKGRVGASTFPQQMLSPHGDYATNASDSVSEGTNKGSGSSSETSQSTSQTSSRTSGVQGTPGDIMRAYQSALLNIDMLICDDLEDLFMQLWDSGHAYNDRVMPHIYFMPRYLGGFWR